MVEQGGESADKAEFDPSVDSIESPKKSGSLCGLSRFFMNLNNKIPKRNKNIKEMSNI